MAEKAVVEKLKENKYDDSVFFEKYSQMSRSQKGLEGAGEWQTLQKLLPDFQDKTVLDLGCGYGWHCRYAAEHGAKEVLGIDLSQKMLAVAREKTESSKYPNISYRLGAIEEASFSAERFDVVLSSLAFHYVKDYQKTVTDVYKWLRRGGSFVFSAEHPVFTSYGSQDWYYGENGEILHFPVDRYYFEGERQANFLGETVTKYHRTLTTYLESLLEAGFSITHVVEPKPAEEMLSIPGMEDEMRRPMMLIVSAEKL